MSDQWDNWPRLSETLPHRTPGLCGNCGEAEVKPDDAGPSWLPSHIVWQEHDWRDKPEMRFVELCRPCGDKLIEPHRRLYAPLNPYTPAAGAMALCVDCVHRDGLRCASPLASFNGGAGILVTGPKPSRVGGSGRGKGARSGWESIYRGPTTHCTGKETDQPKETDDARRDEADGREAGQPDHAVL
jgi:hypothetical protein